MGGSTPPAAKTEVNADTDEDPEPHNNQNNIDDEVTSDQPVVQDHVRWNDNHERPIRVTHESNRTHYEHRDGGKTPRRRTRRDDETGTIEGLNDHQAIAKAKARATKRAARKERQSREWKTLT